MVGVSQPSSHAEYNHVSKTESIATVQNFLV